MPLPGSRLLEVTGLFLKLGTISFGGPTAHIALMEQEVVRKRNWLSREYFLDLLAVTNLVPGPNAVEMATHIWLPRLRDWPVVQLTNAPGPGIMQIVNHSSTM
jgi:chromate transporter